MHYIYNILIIKKLIIVFVRIYFIFALTIPLYLKYICMFDKKHYIQ